MDSKETAPNHLSHHISDDGSSTVHSDLYQAHYHSTHGAIQESMHVFIEKGLIHFLKSYFQRSVAILEMGFGSGLNALLTRQYGSNHDINIDYESYELYPLDIEAIRKLNLLYI